MIISLDKFKNDGSGNGGSGKYVVTDGTKFALSYWETIPEGLDFSQITDFTGMFTQATNLKTGLYLDDWSNAYDCSTMYRLCSGLESVPDMNTSNCLGFINTFQGTAIVNAPNIDVSSATNVRFMFDSCPNLQHIGELNTINVKQPDAFKQLCSICPNLTTVEGIDFSGIVDPVYCQITDSYNGPIMFYQNDSLTKFMVNGAINFSWANDYGFNALPNLTFESIESILTAMSKCINPEVSKIMYFNYVCQDDKLRPLIEDCQSKGWDIQGILEPEEPWEPEEPENDYPTVIIDFVPEQVGVGEDFLIHYTVHDGFDHYASIHDIILNVYDDYGYSEDFVLKSESGTITLNDSNFAEPSFKTKVKYGEQNLAGSIYSYTRVEQTEPEEPGSGEPTFNFWLVNEKIAAGDYIRIQYEITNYDNLGFAPRIIVGTNDKPGAYIPEEYDYRIKDSEGYIEDIKDNSEYEPQCIITLFNPDSGEQIYQTTLSWERVTPGVFFDDGDSNIIIPYTGKTQELTIPFNMYGVDNYWTNNSIEYFGINCNIEVIEGAVENYTHALHIVVDPNPYSFGIDDCITFSYNDSNSYYQEYGKHINLDVNPDSALGEIEVSANYENYYELPSSVDRFEILFNVNNAEYQEAIQNIYMNSLENFNVSFEPTDIEGYTHVAYITYDNKYEPTDFVLRFSNGYYYVDYYFNVKPAKRPSDVDTSVWGNPDDAIPVTMAEFIAAEPSTTQWYEIKGKILTAPEVETGKMLIQSIDGDTGQTVYYNNPWGEKGEALENAVLVNYSWDVALMNPVDGSNGNYWFPGDDMNIIIRTLKHSYDTNVHAIDELGEDNNGTTIAGQYNGSPCAVYVGVYEP